MPWADMASAISHRKRCEHLLTPDVHNLVVVSQWVLYK